MPLPNQKPAGMEGGNKCPLRYHGLVFQLVFSRLSWARWDPVRRHLLLLHCWQLPVPSLPTFSPGHYFASGEGPTRQAQGHPHYVGFSYLTLLTLMLLGVISNTSHNLPPKWCMNNLEKLHWALILKWQFWVMLVQILLWEAGTLCLSLQASRFNVLVLATGFKRFCYLICIYLK